MMSIDELTQKVARHLAGRPVTIKWQNPPSASAAGQITKTPSGDLVIYVGNLTDVNSRFKVYLHELAHARFDHGWIPSSSDHKRPAASIKRTQAERQRWRSHWREERAQAQADEWLQYADKHAPDYWRVGRDAMTCKLLALLDWSE